MLSLETESWIWYGIVMFIVALRFISRSIQLRSPLKLQIEDAVMILVAAFYTLLIVYLNILNTLPTNLIPPDEVDQLDPTTIPARIHGSKIVIVVEQCWCATIWGCKACLLLLYWNLTKGTRGQLAVKIVACYAAFGYVVMEVLFFAAWCRPFYNYWSVPPKNMQCDTYQDHLIVNTVFNISSDLMILSIPLPILLRTTLPLRKKLVLCGIFSLGLFVILCAILSKYYSFHLPYGAEWVNWYVREVSTAVLVANIPHCYVLVRRVFNLRGFLHTHSRPGRSRYGTANSSNPNHPHPQHSQNSQSQTKSLTSSIGARTWYRSGVHARSDSEERITGGGHGFGNSKDMPVRLEIWQDVGFRVDESGEAGLRVERASEASALTATAEAGRTDGVPTRQATTTTRVTTRG